MRKKRPGPGIEHENCQEDKEVEKRSSSVVACILRCYAHESLGGSGFMGMVHRVIECRTKSRPLEGARRSGCTETSKRLPEVDRGGLIRVPSPRPPPDPPQIFFLGSYILKGGDETDLGLTGRVATARGGHSRGLWNLLYT
jgi:hypothetical protein